MDVEYLIEGERAALGPMRRDLAEIDMDAVPGEFSGSALAARLPAAP